MNNNRGFTLLEILVAVSIFAIAAVTLLNAQRTQITTSQHLEEKTYAHWVALNHLAEMRLASRFPDVGQFDSEAEMAGRFWLISTKVQATPTPNVRLLVVSVAVKPDDAEPSVVKEKPEPVTIVTGFLPRPARQNEHAPPS